MEEKKFELIPSDKEGLFRIQALIDFSDVKKGDIGGYVEDEDNISHKGNCWIYNDAIVCDYARVCDNAHVYDNAEVSGKAKVSGNAEVRDNAVVCDNAVVSGNSSVFGHAVVCGDAVVRSDASVYGNACVWGNASVYGDANVYGNARVYGYPNICGNAVIENTNDYLVFKNSWSSGRYFTWTRSNDMWNVGCFYGTGEELIRKAYKDSKESGDNYRKYVEFVERKFLNEGFFKTLKKNILRLKYKFY